LELEYIFSSVYHFSKISIKSLGLMAKAKITHRKAKATFQETLIHHGVPPEIARELSKSYPNPIDEIFSIMKQVRRKG